MESLRDLFVRLGLDWEASGFATAQIAVDLLEKGLQLCVNGVNALADVFVESVKHTAEYGEEIEVLAQKTGISTDAIQKFGYAATLSHSSAEELRSGLQFLSRNMEKAKDGGEEAQKAFAKLGITMSDIRKKSPEEMVFLLADRIKKLGNVGSRTGIVMDVLGRGGAALIPTFDRGAEGLRQMGKEAEDLNIIMSEDAVHAAAAFKESLEKLEATQKGLQQVIAGPLIEAIQPYLDELVAWLRANREMIKQRVDLYVGKVVKVLQFGVKIIRALPDAIEKFVATVKILLVVLAAFIVAQQIINVGLGQTLVNFALNSAAAIAYGAIMVATAIKSAIAWAAAAAPVILLTAALALAALVAEDLYYYLTGGDSVIGELGVKWAKFVEEFSRPKLEDNWLVAALRSALHWILNLEQVWDRLEKGFARAYRFFAFGEKPGDPHKLRPWETDDQAETFNRTKALIRAADEAARQQTRGVLASGGTGGGLGYDASNAWRAQPSGTSNNSTSVEANTTIVVPPGTPPAAAKEAVKEALHEHWNGVMRDAGAATGNPNG